MAQQLQLDSRWVTTARRAHQHKLMPAYKWALYQLSSPRRIQWESDLQDLLAQLEERIGLQSWRHR